MVGRTRPQGCNCTPGNLEIPGSCFACPGMTANDKKRPRSRPGPCCFASGGLALLVAAGLQPGAENVAPRRARIGGTVLCDGFLLLGHFQCLDRDLDLAGLLVELDDARVDLFADRKAFG